MKDDNDEYEIEAAEAWHSLRCDCPYCGRTQTTLENQGGKDKCRYCGKVFIIGEVEEF